MGTFLFEINSLNIYNMYKVISNALKVISIIVLILTCIAIISDEISRATLLAVIAFYTDYQSDRLAK